MKFMIHSCNDRVWYVNEYLIPSMKKQGITDDEIIVFNDDDGIGNLAQWIRSCEFILTNYKDTDFWHLQDDIVICDDFYERVKQLNMDMIINGYVWKKCNIKEYDKFGIQPIQNYWMSFQCDFIPNRYLKSFLDWFEDRVIRAGKYKKYYVQNKFDDFFFWRSVFSRHPKDKVYNVYPCLVDHVGHLIGGSMVSPGMEPSTAAWWNEDRGVLKK